jgi:DNA-binding LacI/PurR family transcriptional regulator
MIQGIESVCAEHGYDILLVQSNQSDSVESGLLRLAPDRVDGLILMLRNQLDPPFLNMLSDIKHVVSIGYALGAEAYPAVLYDNAMAMQLAVDHLIAQGRTRLGFLGECRTHPHADNIAREQAFRSLLAERQLSSHEAWIHSRTAQPQISTQSFAGDSFREGYFGAKHLFAQPGEKPDALVGYNDAAVAGALRYLIEAGLHCPKDCALIGVDDSQFCVTCTPTLSSIGQPLEAMGRLAAKLLLQLIEQDTQGLEATPVVSQTLVPSLIARESTGVVISL